MPGWGRSPGIESGNSLQYSCLKTSVDRGTWGATVHRVSKSQTQLSTQVGCQCVGKSWIYNQFLSSFLQCKFVNTVCSATIYFLKKYLFICSFGHTGSQ